MSSDYTVLLKNRGQILCLCKLNSNLGTRSGSTDLGVPTATRTPRAQGHLLRPLPQLQAAIFSANLG